MISEVKQLAEKFISEREEKECLIAIANKADAHLSFSHSIISIGLRSLSLLGNLKRQHGQLSQISCLRNVRHRLLVLSKVILHLRGLPVVL